MTRRFPARLAAVSTVVAAMLAMLLAVPGEPAWAAAGVTVSNAQGAATADPDYATEVTVTGSGFQSIPKGFGGVYVLFGWVDSNWRPSQGGAVGADYRYVPDSESADNAGYQRFVAFPGSETAAAAHAIMGADGAWVVSMVIPGASFQSRDRDGNVSAVDCLKVTCGIITVGAHGVKNANNETFTPIAFRAPSAPPRSAGEAPANVAASAPRLGLAVTEVEAGSAIVFTGQGFTPGEQVVAMLDDGVTAIGPLTAGRLGDVAGALPTPREIRSGTHAVTLRGASSGSVAQREVSIAGGSVTVSTPMPAKNETPLWLIAVLGVCIVIALVLVIVSVATAWNRGRLRRRAARAERVSAGAAP